MADDSRRGDSNMADADVQPDGGNSGEITTVRNFGGIHFTLSVNLVSHFNFVGGCTY